MSHALIDSVRKEDRDQRFSLIKVLGEAGTKKTEEVINALIYVANGIRGHKRTWRTAFLRREEVHYSLEEMLEAIRGLGNTNSQTAYEFLYNLHAKQIILDKDLPEKDSSGKRVRDLARRVVTFPNAKGPLAKALEFRYVCAEDPKDTFYQTRSGYPVSDADTILYTDKVYAEKSHCAFIILRRALKKLKSDLLFL